MKNPLLFLLTAAMALTSLYVLFKMRYGWYADHEQVVFLNAGFLLIAIGMTAVWKFFPSFVGITLLGIAALCFPPLLRANKFVGIDGGLVAFSLVPLLLLLAATYLRKRHS